MRISLKDLGFALFFLLVITLVAVEAGGEEILADETPTAELVEPAGRN